MSIAEMQHMPLAGAYLCEDCHAVGNCAEQCPACASAALMELAGVLNRDVPPIPVALDKDGRGLSTLARG